MGGPGLDVEFTGDVWHWRGPAPFHFVTVPDDESAQLAQVARAVTYGWGMVPIGARIGTTTWRTSLFPKDGGYVLPVKDAVRRAEQIDIGDTVTVHLTLGGDRTR
jgi:hypothetical protein